MGNRSYKLFTKLALLICAFSAFSCGSDDINSIADPHFDTDGTPFDTLDFFTPAIPESARLYVETSGSMNGFFSANRSNKFKKTVWSVFSGLQPLTDNNVYTLSRAGDIDSPINISTFRSKMNRGEFVSTTDTHIPTMLTNIISRITPNKNEIAVLVSDMKYSPMGKDAAPNIAQYQEQIRNLTACHNHGVAFVCAESEFFRNSTVAEENSPYYFIIIGKPETVAEIRNNIMTWCEATDSYIESGDMGMHYRNPPYTIHSIRNGVAHSRFPNNVITTFSRDVSDTCSFVVRIDLTGYPAGINPIRLNDCFHATTSNGANITHEIIDLQDDHHVKGQFKRKAFADYLVKVFDIPLDDEVVEFTFSNRPFDGCYNTRFGDILSATSENELDKTFSFNKFIEGHFNARFNEFALEPGKEQQVEPRHVRILISHSVE